MGQIKSNIKDETHKRIKQANQLSAVLYIDNNYTTNKQNIVTSHNIYKTNGTQQGRTNSPCKHMPPHQLFIVQLHHCSLKHKNKKANQSTTVSSGSGSNQIKSNQIEHII